ncbi:BMC domain-containing protein [Salmonella enterica subsp. enterica serovar Enteritidis]|nr:BMC domain-containing protein [Salmonella enterica subsp. enterica serovar Enteritidis]
MSQAIGILELTSIAKGMELGDAMLKSANVDLLVSKTICPGKFLLMLGGDIGAIQQAIETGTSQAGEMLVDSLVRVHMAFGIGGKCYMVVAGDVSDVNNAVTVASESAGEKGLLVYRSVIPRPHEAMWRQMVEG